MNLKSSQKLPVSVKFTDAKGFEAPAENIVWSSTDESVFTVSAAADGLSAVVSPVGVGTAKVNLLADGKIGEGEAQIAGELEVTVLAGDAITVTLSAGTPVEA